jgi:hypothetical protein
MPAWGAWPVSWALRGPQGDRQKLAHSHFLQHASLKLGDAPYTERHVKKPEEAPGRPFAGWLLTHAGTKSSARPTRTLAHPFLYVGNLTHGVECRWNLRTPHCSRPLEAVAARGLLRLCVRGLNPDAAHARQHHTSVTQPPSSLVPSKAKNVARKER